MEDEVKTRSYYKIISLIKVQLLKIITPPKIIMNIIHNDYRRESWFTILFNQCWGRQTCPQKMYVMVSWCVALSYLFEKLPTLDSKQRRVMASRNGSGKRRRPGPWYVIWTNRRAALNRKSVRLRYDGIHYRIRVRSNQLRFSCSSLLISKVIKSQYPNGSSANAPRSPHGVPKSLGRKETLLGCHST